MRVDFVTLFPEQALQAVNHSILKRAADAGLVSFHATNPRDFTQDRHRTVDSQPYGGGPGMVMMCEPLAAALDSIGAPSPPSKEMAVVFTDPTGQPFSQAVAREMAKLERLVLVCGHYEGIDDRLRQLYATHTLTIGDYVLTGGELPALVIADAVVRLLPGALGCADSLQQDSFAETLLSAPQYTRPEVFRGIPVPPVLRSGNHGAIAAWRRRQALQTTRRNRPDLLWRAALSGKDVGLLEPSDGE